LDSFEGFLYSADKVLGPLNLLADSPLAFDLVGLLNFSFMMIERDSNISKFERGFTDFF
jgi:hypothetical protein